MFVALLSCQNHVSVKSQKISLFVCSSVCVVQWESGVKQLDSVT